VGEPASAVPPPRVLAAFETEYAAEQPLSRPVSTRSENAANAGPVVVDTLASTMPPDGSAASPQFGRRASCQGHDSPQVPSAEDLLGRLGKARASEQVPQ